MIEGIEDEEIRKKVEEIFEFYDYDHFYQILAYFRFRCLYEKYGDKISKNWFKRYEWMLKKYIIDDFSDKAKESNIVYLKNLHHNARKIAYLILDSFYTPAGLNLSSVLLFGNPELMLSIVFDETEISNTLKFLNRQLYKSVYLNEKVLAIQSLYYEPLKEELTRKVENIGSGENICDFIEEIYGGLNIQKIRKENRKKKSEYVPIMRFEFEGNDLNEQLKEKLDKSSLVEINLNCYRVVWRTPLNFYVIQYNSKSDKQSSIATFKESFDTVKEFLKGIKDRDSGANYIKRKKDMIEKMAKKYIEQALKIFFNNEGIRWEWKHTSFLRSYFNFPDAVIGLTDDVYTFYQKNIILKFNEKYDKTPEANELYREKMRSIGGELEAKLKVIEKLKEGEKLIEGYPDILCMTISNLIAYSINQQPLMENQQLLTAPTTYSMNQQPLMEVDGLILGLTTEKQLFICLIEAKSGIEGAVGTVKSKITDRGNDIFRGYDISNLINLVRGLDYNSIAYLIITDEKIPTSSNP